MFNNEIDACEELHQNFIDFAYEANSQRAFPDARDGLKPGQRACLWDMYKQGFTSNKPHVKSAKISGSVIASLWPHSNDAIYETFARMSQPWINNIPEVSWHGSNGNVVIGPECASARYTEARLAKAAEDGMFSGIKKNNVPMILNFSEDEEWPEVLPSIFPRLMVNGSQGIGVTIAQTFLPHSLKDMTDILSVYIKEKNLPHDLLQKLAPDFPSGGVIINKDELLPIYETGKGKVVLRAKATIEGNVIVITELPYQVYVEPLIEDIKKLVISGELAGIKDIYNKSDKDKLRIDIECDSSPATVLGRLYSLTDLQKSYNSNQWALVGKTPKLLNLIDYCRIYTDHNYQCIKREYEFDLNKTKARLEIVEGLVKALEDIDNIIALIKKSESGAAAKENLIKKYQFTENQAKAIVDMKLGRLAHLEKIELEKEHIDLTSTLKNINDVLSSSEKIEDILLERLNTFTKIYGGPRRTELIQLSTSSADKEIENVPPQEVIITITKDGMIKRTPKESIKIQKRAGKGTKTADAAIINSISTNTVDYLLLFSDKGQMYKLLADNVPETTGKNAGTAINSLIKIDADEKIVAATALSRQDAHKYVIFFTKNGLVKKTEMSEYTSLKRAGSGVVAIKLKPNDSIVDIRFFNDEPAIIVTKAGMAIKFSTSDIAAIGRNTSGVKGITLIANDYVVAGLPIEKEDDYVILVSAMGAGKRFLPNQIPLKTRGGFGIKVPFEVGLLQAR